MVPSRAPPPSERAPTLSREAPQPTERDLDVFLSYAREDAEHARALATLLTSRGLKVFWDREIPAGRQFRQVIEDALKSAKCVVVLWSKASVKSHWVHEEATVGVEREVLVPAILEEVTPPLGFRSLQCADLRPWADAPERNSDIESFVGAVDSTINAAKPPEA